MEIPVLVCYTIDRALEILKERGINNISVTVTGTCSIKGDGERVDRVIGQRKRNGLVELIVS
jgi:thiamine biosynthesis lipoprotein ApbE